MAKNPPEQVHLYRLYRTEPFYRFAVTIEEDPSKPAGFRTVASDPRVADSSFIARLDAHFRQPVEAHYTEERGGGTVVGGTETVNPGQSGYFDVAARSVPFAHIGKAPE